MAAFRRLGRGDTLDHAADVAAPAAHIGAPVVGGFRGRGVPPHEPEAAAVIAEADVLLAVGGDLDGMTTRNRTMPRPPRLVVLDAAPPVDPPGVGGRCHRHRPTG